MPLYLQDDNGQWYLLGVDTLGNLTTTTFTPPPTPPVGPSPQCTITLADTMEWAKRLNFARNAAVGSSLEPALTSANIVKQAILGAPFEWRWNRKEYQWTCVDPDVVWQAHTSYPLGFRFEDSNGNLQTVTTSNVGSYTAWQASHTYNINDIVEPSPAFYTGYYYICTGAGVSDTTETGWSTIIGVPSFEGTAQFEILGVMGSGATEPTWSTDTANNGVTTDGSLIWTCSDIQTYIQYVPDLGWIEHGSVFDITTDVEKWFTLQQKLSLELDSSTARPRYISAHTDDNQGNIGFVLTPVPDKAYPINIHIQKKAELFASTADTWSPIPDEYSYIYNWGFLALMYMFADDPRFAIANQKFVSALLASNEGLTETERNIFLGNWAAVTGISPKEQQGMVARGV
jgi:hypothetical protein